MNQEQRAILVRSWIEKADSALQDANLLNENERLNSCVTLLKWLLP
jgi:uncharacterized protein (UPF0332 family)